MSKMSRILVAQELLSRKHCSCVHSKKKCGHHRPSALFAGASLADIPRASLTIPPALLGVLIDSADGFLEGSLLFSAIDFSTSCSTAGVVAPGESSSRMSPRSLMKTQRAKQRAFKGAQKMKTALLALVYALAIASWSWTLNVERSGAANVLFATYERCSGKEPRSTFARIAEETARPTAPPELRKKLRLEVTTALCIFGVCACSATSVGWKTIPVPIPMRIRKKDSKPTCKFLFARMRRPDPQSQIPNPPHSR